MTEQRKREIRSLERLRTACRIEAKARVPDQPQLGGLGLHTSSPEWRALFDALFDARYYDARASRWVRCVDKAIEALTKQAAKGGTP